jgi:hypothetical protein
VSGGPRLYRFLRGKHRRADNHCEKTTKQHAMACGREKASAARGFEKVVEGPWPRQPTDARCSRAYPSSTSTSPMPSSTFTGA